MGSIETSDGGSLRVLGVLQVLADQAGTATSLGFIGQGVGRVTLIEQGERFVVDLSYDGPAGIDQTEWTGALGQAPNIGDTANQLPTAIAPVDDDTFRVYLNSHDGAQSPKAISQGVFIAVWRNKGALVTGTIVIPPA